MKNLKKNTRPASHRKGHLAALSNPGVRDQLESLRTEWPELNDVRRGDQLIQLRSAGCSKRGLAHDLRVDDGTIRRNIKIARLTELQRKSIEAGADAKQFLTAAREDSRMSDMRERYLREMRDGSASDELRDKLAWFLLTELPEVCCAGDVERLFGEVQTYFAEKTLNAAVMHNVKFLGLDPAYPLKSAIKLAKPAPDPEEFWVATAIQWLLKLIQLLEPIKDIRDHAIEKLKTTLTQLHLQSVEIQGMAKQLTYATLAPVLRERAPEIPLYH